MSYLLDTNILSAHLRRPAGLQHRFMQHSGRLYTSSVALAELYDWAYRRPDSAAALAAVDKMLLYEVATIEFDSDCAKECGRLRAELRQQGIGIAAMDLLIGTVALLFDLTLVTHNTKDFQNIPGLRLEDWLTQ
ncbi:MAG: type II toxin-antitoxin system VapC family toxin [Thermoguttaceae bacterium]